MGEMWLVPWIFAVIGLFVIAVAIYDYFDRKKHGQEIKKWKHVLAIVIGFVLMWPVYGAIIIRIPLFFPQK